MSRTTARGILDPADMEPERAERYVVISIDLEMRWGRHDRLGADIDAYRANFEAGRAAVPEILRILRERRLNATWAAVGALACSGWDEYFRRAPKPPRYDDRGLAVDPRYADLDPEGVLHFAPAELGLIANAPGQDLGTHTFSHLYMREPGISASDVADDLEAVRRLWLEAFGREPLTLVFPRNQPSFMDVVERAGVLVWRGNPEPWYHDRHEASRRSMVSRGLRFADALFPLSKVARAVEARNCRASAFVRFDLPVPLWRLHTNRLRGELNTMVAGDVLHLWFHEHNLGADLDRGLERLVELCDLIAEACDTGKACSANMAAFAGVGGRSEPRIPRPAGR